MSVSLTLLTVWLLTMPVAYALVLAVYPPYLRRRASRRQNEREAFVSDLDLFRARKTAHAALHRRSASR